jgi:sulfoxide reductase heme-binding subunit YedZ
MTAVRDATSRQRAGRASGPLSRVEPHVRRWIRPAMWVVVLGPVVWLAVQAFTGGLGADPIDKLERESGQWTLRMLAASLVVTPLMRLTGWGWLVSQRRFLGLAAFFYAAGHLSVYIGLDWFFDVGEIVQDILKHLYVTVGMLGFLLLVPLALTSTKSSIRRLGGKRWNLLHRLVYLSAAAGCVHFLWAVKKDVSEPILYITIFAVLFAFRIYWWRRGRSSRGSVRGAGTPVAAGASANASAGASPNGSVSAT